MTVYIVDIEAVDTRYTKQWKQHLPVQLKNQLSDSDIVVISGGETPQATTPGAFLNFGGTNVYKSNQLLQIGEMFCNGTIKDNSSLNLESVDSRSPLILCWPWNIALDSNCELTPRLSSIII